MRSPNSTEKSTSAKSFEMDILKMIKELEMKNVDFFQKTMMRSTVTEVVQGPFAYSLEFPYDFLKSHGTKFGLDATFQIPKCNQTWPIKVTVREFKQTKSRVFAYGPGGWKAFLMDNQIKVGDILVFSLTGFSQFLVYIGRAPKAEVPHDEESLGKWLGKSSWWNPNETPALCKLCKHTPPSPRFVATVRHSRRPEYTVHHAHLESEEFSLQDVPGSFWERHRRMLKCDVLQLKGPNKDVRKVKVEKTYDVNEQKLTVRLGSGWKAFLAANDLHIGDNLEFSLMGPSSFTVDLLDSF